MRNDSIAAALCAALLVPLPTHAAPAQNQTAATGKTQAAPAVPAQSAAPSIAVSDTVAVPVWPKAAVTLPVNQPIAASFALGAVEGINPALLSGVTAKGYARKVEAGPQTVGQVLVTSVAKGEREETISTEGLTAQFDAKGANELFPEKTLEVKGSKSALIAALERLAKTEKKDEAKKPANDGSVRQGSDKGRSNDLAAQYRTPATVTPTPAPEKQSSTEVRTSTEGCRVRVDLAQGKAIRQSKEQTFTDGVLAGESQCTDSDVS
ncbi:secreted protein, partial [Magnetospirillum fulvum MGU-K5]